MGRGDDVSPETAPAFSRMSTAFSFRAASEPEERGMIESAKFARENKVPFFGICLGMQIALSSSPEMFWAMQVPTAPNSIPKPHIRLST
jgi:imidazoleglycerol phosphate synthase glutamine amidotransferase subunit HisH